MSSKGTKKSLATREKMSLAKQQHKLPDLIELANKYITELDTNPNLLPSLANFCQQTHITKASLLEYCSRSSELTALIDTIQIYQENYLLNRADQSKNPTFQIFMLKSKHGYTDQPPSMTQNNTFQISPDILAEALSMMKKNPQ